MQGKSFYCAILAVEFVILISPSFEAASIRNNTVRRYFIRLQPELDVIDIDTFVRNDHVLKFQLKCLLNNDTYCDPIGRWLAPRLPFMLLRGQCPKCTDVQRNKISDGLNFVRREKPNIYQALVDRYIVQEEDEELQDTAIIKSKTGSSRNSQNDKDFALSKIDTNQNLEPELKQKAITGNRFTSPSPPPPPPLPPDYDN